MEQYASQSRWPFFDIKTPRPIIAVRRELATGDKTLPKVIDSTIRVLEKPPSQITISYLPGTRPDNGKWKKVSYHARSGDSFYDGKYGDLGIVITNPLEIYENDSEEVKDAIHKFCKLASKIQTAQEILEEGWMEFFGDGDRNDLVRKAPTPSDSVTPFADALPSIEVSPPADATPATEATAATEVSASTEGGEQDSNDGEVKGYDDGEAQVGGKDKAQE